MPDKESIFRAYDIRGVYGETLTDEIVSYIPASFLSIVKTKKVIIGRDARNSSDRLLKILKENFSSCGVYVIDIGMVSTDMFYFACGERDIPGIMITASHNPKEYNGFKMIKKIPKSICRGSGMEEIEKGVNNKIVCEKKEKLVSKKYDISKGFIEKLFSIVNKNTINPLTVVIDSGNGMTGIIWKDLSKKLPIKLIPLYFKPDGSFPNHEPDPLKPKNRIDVENNVKKYNADIGFAFDADGDRCFVIDDRGKSIPSEFITALIAEYLLKKVNKKETILYDVRSSWVIRDHIKSLGHNTIRERVGHSFIKETMSRKKILFGGEVSGHFYFRDFFYSDSGALSALIMLYIISSSGKKLSDIIYKWEKKYFISGEINFKINNIKKLFNELQNKYQNGYLDNLDGLSIEYDDEWHCNIRASNTESVIRLNCEAKNETLLIEKKNDIIKFINKYK